MSRDTNVVLELKAKVETLTKELADVKLQLGNALTANSVLEQKLVAETEAVNKKLRSELEIAERDRDFFDNERMKIALELDELKKEDDRILQVNSDVIAERDKIAREAETELSRLRSILSSHEPLTDFEAVWAKMEAQGYQYGEDELEQVRFGWYLAQEALMEWRKSRV